MLSPGNTAPSKIKGRWLAVAAYAALIYSTLTIARVPTQFLRSRGMLRPTLTALYIAAATGVFWQMSRNRIHNPWRWIGTAGVLAAYALLSRHIAIPEEQLHFMEYGLMGILTYRAVEPHAQNPVRRYALASLLASLIGWGDEILQGLTPGRHYDLADVGLNALSAAMGLALHALTTPLADGKMNE